MSKDKSDPRHPTVIYIEKVCKKASEEGFELALGQKGFIWQDKKSGKKFGGQWNQLEIPILMLEACIAIENNQGWNVLAEIEQEVEKDA
jgi:hypothetical protein